MSSLEITRTQSSNKDFLNLVSQLDKDLLGRYHAEQKNYDQHNQVESIDTVIVIYNKDVPVACGCFKPFDSETVEIKRMFVCAASRGKGISKIILKELEKWAKELGFVSLILETGEKQHEAIGLYESQGFKRIYNYGPYVDMPNSVCFRKSLI